MMSDNIKPRIMLDQLFKATIVGFSCFIFIPLIFIIWYIVVNGFAAINWEFLTQLPKPVGEEGGGIANAIIGTLMLIGIASAIALPLGIFSGVCLSELKGSWFTDLIKISVEVLQSIPSIVLGIIAYIWIVVPMGSFSALSGGVALSLMMLPTIIRTTEETIKLIPNTLKEASISLGVPYYKTILKVILPASYSGIITGTLLGVARIAGETAPLLFTAFGNSFMNLNLFKTINALPLLIYNYATSPYAEWQQIAWGASFVLICFTFLLSLSAKLVVKK